MLTVRKIDPQPFKGKKYNCLALSCFNTTSESPNLKIDSYIAVSPQCGALLEKSFAEGWMSLMCSKKV